MKTTTKHTMRPFCLLLFAGIGIFFSNSNEPALSFAAFTLLVLAVTAQIGNALYQRTLPDPLQYTGTIILLLLCLCALTSAYLISVSHKPLFAKVPQSQTHPAQTLVQLVSLSSGDFKQR